MPEAATRLPVKTDKPAAPARSQTRSPFESLRREIDRLFEDLHPFGRNMPATRALFDFDAPNLRGEGWFVVPAIDVVERDGEFEISAELPGIEEKNVEIKLANRVLTIKGEKKENKEEQERDYYLSERRYGSFQRAFQIPEGVNTDQITASFANGVLTVVLPKTVEAKNAEKKIEVKAG